MRLVQDFIGKYVVARSAESGVWLGVLADAEGKAVRLVDGRRAWFWRGAGSCSALAVTGPQEGKIALPVPDTVVTECCEVLVASDEAVAAWLDIDPWTGR